MAGHSLALKVALKLVAAAADLELEVMVESAGSSLPAMRARHGPRHLKHLLQRLRSHLKRFLASADAMTERVELVPRPLNHALQDLEGAPLLKNGRGRLAQVILNQTSALQA